jgi:hypothetical protein
VLLEILAGLSLSRKSAPWVLAGPVFPGGLGAIRRPVKASDRFG